MQRIFSSTLLALVAALALTACGTSDNSDSSGSDFNDADVTFTQSMIPHHEQAVQMARMARLHASTPEVKNLAEVIEAAQSPEIATMEGWLEEWGQDESDSNSGMGHGSDDMPGMMSDDDLSGLEATTGSGFDRMFLTMMIEHHNGAIEMAKTERSKGKNADAKALAKRIEADQTAEIAQMRKLLAP
jgi:uncharacterized protein (DUF305 family)